LRAFLILTAIVASLSMLPSVDAAGMLVGQVIGNDMDGHLIPLGWANVTAYSNGILVQSVSPGFDGSYSMSLPSGLYVVRVEHPGFNAQSKVVEISNGRSSRLDFYLERASIITSNAFDFGLSSSGPVMVPAGKSGWITIQVTLRSGSPQIVSLSVSGLPSGASVSLSSPSDRPSFTSICIITTSPATSVGSYIVTLIGVGGGMTHSASFTLTISPGAYSPDIA